MSTQNSLDILTSVLKNIKHIEVLSVLNNITEKFTEGGEKAASTTAIPDAKTPPVTTPPVIATLIPDVKTKTPEKKESVPDKYDTEYLIKWAFIGLAIFAGILILFSIIYYLFFSSNSTPENSEDMNLQYSQYYPDENSYESRFKQSSSYSSQNSQNNNKSDQSMFDSKNISNKQISQSLPSLSPSQEPEPEPEPSYLDMFNSKKTENPTMNKIVGGKKR
jgi:hypothetical protein